MACSDRKLVAGFPTCDRRSLPESVAGGDGPNASPFRVTLFGTSTFSWVTTGCCGSAGDAGFQGRMPRSLASDIGGRSVGGWRGVFAISAKQPKTARYESLFTGLQRCFLFGGRNDLKIMVEEDQDM